jgi:radical SAM protein with 4Fe4S-binding SPASM domain
MDKLERAVVEVFGGCNYSCEMCPQATGRGSNWTRKMPLDLFNNILDQLPGKPVINLEGSGEPTMAKDLPKYIQACTDKGFESFMYCNGTYMRGQFMRDCIDAGLGHVRFSCIGYNEELYAKWMSKDRFTYIRDNAWETMCYIQQSESNCQVSSYHLITDNTNTDYEVEQYRKNWIDWLGCTGYIWRMHNWSGNYDPVYDRAPKPKKSCGRPFAPELTVRAGGIAGLQGAVTPCCQTMGPPNEDKSVLGHMQTQTLEEIWYGEAYNKLRKDHEMGEWPDYCENCDFLYEDPEVLVWSNDPKASTDYMLGTNFSLADFKPKF